MKNKIFGFNRQEVANYLEQLLHLQENELNKLADEHRLIIEENKQMRVKIEQLNSELSKMQDMAALNFMLDRLESVNKYLDRYTDESTGKILNQRFGAKKKLNEQIESITFEITEVKNSIKKELDQINKLIKSSNFFVVPNPAPLADKLAGPFNEPGKPDSGDGRLQTVNKQLTADGTVIPEKQEASPELGKKKPSGNDDMAAYLEYSSFWGKNDTRELKVKTSPQTESIYSAPELRQPSSKTEEPAADKMIVLNAPATPAGHPEMPAGNSQALNQTGTEPALNVSVNRQALSITANKQALNETRNPQASNEAAYISTLNEAGSNPPLTKTGSNLTESNLTLKENKKNQTSQTAAYTPREPEPRSDRELKAKIDLVRNRYILGKFAGEDVLDSNGNFIVKKHEEITPEVLEAAQRENKLSDIIINMIIPGMDG